MVIRYSERAKRNDLDKNILLYDLVEFTVVEQLESLFFSQGFRLNHIERRQQVRALC